MTAREAWTIAALVAGVAALGALATAAGPTGAGQAASTPDGGLRTTVRIQLQTVPPEKATVMWGRKELGLVRGPRKPLIIDRPRDSGPLDLVIRADGYVPVHTRAYTFTDSKLAIKLTKLADRKTLFGYREEVAIPDGGAPPDSGVPRPTATPTDASPLAR
jgi:hypothetical protein